MGLTQKLGTIPLAIQTDSSNNVGIGGAANASYKLDVIGTTRVSTALTISSTTNAGLIAATNSTTGYTYLDLINNGASGRNYQIGVGGNAAAAGYANNLYFDLVGVGNIMTLTSGRNVGIGTSSPNDLLEVRGGFIRLSATAGNGPQFNIYSNGQTSNHITLAQGFALATDNIGYLYNRANADFVFGTNNSERMRITSGGDVQVQGTNSNAKIILFRNYSNSQPGISVYNTSNTEVMYFNGNTGGLGLVQSGNTFASGFNTVNTSGNAWGLVAGGDNNFYIGYNSSSRGYFSSSTGVYVAVSDFNKKKDFEESTIGLTAILGIKPMLYRMKNADETSNKELGFIAQQVKDFIPQAYMETGDEENKFIGLTDRPIIAALVKAVQELSAKVTALENK